MKRAVHDRRFLANMFHDGDLDASGQAAGTDVVAQHPECRPDTLAVGDLNSCLKPSVGLSELILSEQSGRSVVASYAVGPGKGFLERFDYQQTAFDMRVDCAVGISLEFVVTPTVSANIKGPLARIDRRAAGTIELVTPHQAPHRRNTGKRCCRPVGLFIYGYSPLIRTGGPNRGWQ